MMSGSVITGQELKNPTAGEHWIAGFQERRQVQRSRQSSGKEKGGSGKREVNCQIVQSVCDVRSLGDGARKVGKQDQDQQGNSQKLCGGRICGSAGRGSSQGRLRLCGRPRIRAPESTQAWLR